MIPLAIPLNLPSILLDDIKLTSYKFYFVLNKNFYHKFLNTDVINLINSLGVEVTAAEYFYKNHKNVGLGSHVDDLVNKDFVKINWIYGDLNASMLWRLPLDNYPGEVNKNFGGHSYLYFPPDRTIDMKSIVIHSPSIVQVGIPHTITNISTERWAVSLTVKRDGQYISMDESIDLFRDYIG